MKKKMIISVILIVAMIIMIVLILKNDNKRTNYHMINMSENNTIDAEIDHTKESREILNQTISENKVENMESVYIKVNHQVLQVELENNAATRALKERLKNGDITVDAHEYGGFEKVGNLGFSLPREDTSVTTSSGDIVLYQGNQISLFYDSNSWNYTKLGKIQNISSNELKDILGSGDVIIILTLSR